MKEQAEAETRLSIQQCEQQKNRCRTNQTVQTLSQASECRAEPKTEEPEAAKTPALIPAHAAENRAGNERAENGLGHDDPSEQKGAARAKINQTGQETAPIIGQPFSD